MNSFGSSGVVTLILKLRFFLSTNFLVIMKELNITDHSNHYLVIKLKKKKEKFTL